MLSELKEKKTNYNLGDRKWGLHGRVKIFRSLNKRHISLSMLYKKIMKSEVQVS